LLWNLDDGTTYLDRVYPAGSKYEELLNSWAIAKGYKTYGSLHGGNYQVVMKFDNYTPSIDTFSYMKFDDKTKTVILSTRERAGAVFCTVDGYPPHKSIPRCYYCYYVYPKDQWKKIENLIVCNKCAGKLKPCKFCEKQMNPQQAQNAQECCDKCFEKLFIRCTFCSKEADKKSAIKLHSLHYHRDYYCCGEACRETAIKKRENYSYYQFKDFTPKEPDASKPNDKVNAEIKPVAIKPLKKKIKKIKPKAI